MKVIVVSDEGRDTYLNVSEVFQESITTEIINPAGVHKINTEDVEVLQIKGDR